jgi:hypothetical protein
MRFDILCRSDIIRWRDDCAEEAGEVQPRAGLAAMLKYAEALGYLRKGSNPCRGTPRFKRKAMERFSARRSIGGLGWRWTKPKMQPLRVAIIRLLLYTGARARDRRPAMGLGASCCPIARPAQDDLVVRPGGADLGIRSAPRVVPSCFQI